MADQDGVGELEKRLAGELRWDEKTCEAAVELAKTQRRFDLAWRVLDRTDLSAASPLRDWRWQQYALCKSQDHDIPTDERHREALNDLERELSLSKTTDDHETLGIAGGICKRWWREDGQRVHLHRAFAYYYRGYKAAGSDDLGYNGINAAFLLDLFALEELDAGMPVSSPLVKDRLDLADEMRTAIAAMPLTKPYTRWWPYVTIAEAELGLGRINHARAVLELATAHGILPSDLQKEVALRQLPVVARNHALRIGNAQYQHDAEAMLSEVLGVPPAAVRNATVGKVGLALSGGGFRASLFHIGVLARLAEADLLRDIEVISCVSGGSIIGAYYYLALRKAIEAKDDLTRQDFIELVRNVQEQFLAGVQENIRTRVVLSPEANLKMFAGQDYSRTDRAGELFEEIFYAPLLGRKPPVYLSDLRITPPGGRPEARPRDYNWKRQTKVPILILNATTLNTGHQWQFTSTYMGEPPQRNVGIEAVERWRRVSYENEVPDDYKEIRLGRAVGASACVPGLFTPIIMRNLYEDRVVRLVDGGVHDNQGVATLLAEECNVVLVSDASGQLTPVKSPGGDIVPVILRSDEVLQARLRESQIVDLKARRDSGMVQGMMFIHLTRDLDQTTVTTPQAREKKQPPPENQNNTSYGIRKDIQRKLAEVRTDLDSFSAIEAYALMASGYLMTGESLTNENLPTLIAAGAVPTSREPWTFLAMADALGGGAGAEHVLAHLSLSNALAGRVWHLSPALTRVRKGASPLAFALLAIGTWLLWPRRIAWLLGGLAALIPLRGLWRRGGSAKSIQERLIGLLTVPLSAPAWLHVKYFDREFLRLGKWPPEE